MASKKLKTVPASGRDADPTALDIPSDDGKAPKTRISNAYQVWNMCDEMNTMDEKRGKKRNRIYKAYNRFPPSDYSTLFEQGQEWQSNCNFGMLAYVVDNAMSSFIDMVTERPTMAEIKTKFGKTDREKQFFSEIISIGFDTFLNEWDEYLLNTEQDLLDMHLYGKGIEMWEDVVGCTTEHVSADDFLVPDGAKISLCNFDVLAIKRKYSLHELWEKIDSGSGETRGWKKDAVIQAMRYCRDEWRKEYKTNEEYSKAIAEGDVVLGGHLKEYVNCYIAFIREFSTGKVSKYVVLQDYTYPISLTRGSQKNRSKDAIKKEGFLFEKTNYTNKIDDIFSVFMDSAGSGMWHLTPSLAEKIFVQCRQYDFAMNAIMDAVKMNMSLILQASTPEASEKIKSLVFGPHTIIPSDVPFVQQRIQLSTQEATGAVQFMMLDMFRGIGEYRLSERASGGTPVTATQNANDTAEAAKLSGTQLKRYNTQMTIYYRKLFKRFIEVKSGGPDYDRYEKFKEFMRENKVPPAAYESKNIVSVKSTMLAGAGSQSYKVMAAEKTITLTNISPKDRGQANAVKDGIAALHGRQNVGRYVNDVTPDPDFNERMPGYEDQLLCSPLMNPRDVQVQPDDNDVHHLDVHFFDMNRTMDVVNEKMQDGSLTAYVGEAAAMKLMNQIGHCMAHLDKLSRDSTKEEITKEANKKLQEIRTKAQGLAKQIEAYKKAKESEGSGQYDATKDPQVAQAIALSQIEVKKTQDLANIKLQGTAQSHQQRLDIDQEKAANQIAIDRAKAESEMQTKSAASSNGES